MSDESESEVDEVEFKPELSEIAKLENFESVPKKSTFQKPKTFTREHVEEFLKTAPDETYLDMKVILIFGIAGCCRGGELYNIKKHHVKPQGDVLLVEIPETKTRKPRRFIIDEEFIPYIKKYQDLRNERITHNNYFSKYINGKLHNQVVGKLKIAKVAQDIAKFLKLEDHKRYIGHCFRRTSASFAVKGGAKQLQLKRLGGWTSSKTPEKKTTSRNELEKSVSKEISLLNTHEMKTETCSTTSSFTVADEENVNISLTPESAPVQMCFSNCNVTINYNSSV